MKFIKAFVLSSFIALVPVQQSQAAVGVVTGNAILVTQGLNYAIGGLQVGVGIGFFNYEIQNPFWAFIGNVAVVTMFGGLIILDEDENTDFMELLPEGAEKFKLTESEFYSYNDEVESINILFDEVQYELDQIESPTKEDSTRLWKNSLEYLSKDSVNALTKIIKFNCKK